MNDKDARTLLDEVRQLKMLLILQLLAHGLKQKQIAQVLGVSEATMSRMLPKGTTKGLTKASPSIDIGDA